MILKNYEFEFEFRVSVSDVLVYICEYIVFILTKREYAKSFLLTFNLLSINFNASTFLKLVSTSKSRVTYDLDTDRVTYDLDRDRVTYDLDTDFDTTTHKINGVVESPLYLATPVSTTLLKSHLSLYWKRIHINRPCPDTDSRVFLF